MTEVEFVHDRPLTLTRPLLWYEYAMPWRWPRSTRRVLTIDGELFRAAFAVPPINVGELETGSYANAAEQARMFWRGLGNS